MYQSMQINMLSRVSSRRKSGLKEPQKFHPKYSNDQFSNCISTQLQDYRAVDYPWFANSEFVEYLNRVGIAHVSRLARVEWSVIRSSLGKVRRFSDKFLREEKDKLNDYRDSAMDIDCMPRNLPKNMPACLESFNVLKATGLLKDQKLESFMKFSSGETSHNNRGGQSSDAAIDLNPAKIQEKEADIQALADLNRVLDKKEALLSELKNMNDDIMQNRINGNDLENSDTFKKQYAAVLVQLDDINKQVFLSLLCLRQRNGYQEKSILACDPQPAANLGDSCHVSSPSQKPEKGIDHPVKPDLDSPVIIECSGTKASRTLIDEAIQAMNSLNQGHNILDKNDSKISSKLISHCVSTLVMIQTLIEQQVAPTVVVQVLDSAAANLRSCCSQNLPIYSEIDKCMGIIRNYILGLKYA